MSQRFDFGDGKLVPVRIHANGGGIIALTAHVDPSVHVGPSCHVWGHAKIHGKVRIVGSARIYGEYRDGGVSVQIEDDAIISGNVHISGVVLIRDKAEVRDNARLSGCVQVMHRARISGDAVLEGDVQVLEGAYVTGKTRIVSLGRRTIIRGEHYMNGTEVEHTVRNDNQRKRRVTALRSVIYDSIAA